MLKRAPGDGSENNWLAQWPLAGMRYPLQLQFGDGINILVSGLTPAQWAGMLGWHTLQSSPGAHGLLMD